MILNLNKASFSQKQPPERNAQTGGAQTGGAQTGSAQTESRPIPYARLYFIPVFAKGETPVFSLKQGNETIDIGKTAAGIKIPDNKALENFFVRLNEKQHAFFSGPTAKLKDKNTFSPEAVKVVLDALKANERWRNFFDQAKESDGTVKIPVLTKNVITEIDNNKNGFDMNDAITNPDVFLVTPGEIEFYHFSEGQEAKKELMNKRLITLYGDAFGLKSPKDTMSPELLKKIEEDLFFDLPIYVAKEERQKGLELGKFSERAIKHYELMGVYLKEPTLMAVRTARYGDLKNPRRDLPDMQAKESWVPPDNGKIDFSEGYYMINLINKDPAIISLVKTLFAKYFD